MNIFYYHILSNLLLNTRCILFCLFFLQFYCFVQRQSIVEDVKVEEIKIKHRLSLDSSSSKTSEGMKSDSSKEAEFRLNINSIKSLESSSWERVSNDKDVRLVSNDSTSISSSMRPTFEDNKSLSAPKDFVFKDYLPKLFSEVRSICKINPDEYSESFLHTTQEKFSEGRSGAFLYFSSNLKYIVKTTTEDESIALRNIMEQYVSYIKQNLQVLVKKKLLMK